MILAYLVKENVKKAIEDWRKLSKEPYGRESPCPKSSSEDYATQGVGRGSWSIIIYPPCRIGHATNTVI